MLLPIFFLQPICEICGDGYFQWCPNSVGAALRGRPVGALSSGSKVEWNCKTRGGHGVPPLQS
jgi:hypothetical protein